jgi:hypothetical protein
MTEYHVKFENTPSRARAMTCVAGISPRAALGAVAGHLGRPVNGAERRTLARRGELRLTAGARAAEVWVETA